jgi:TolA-binding protein
MEVRFNEGSRFALTAGTRGQIRSVDRDGARVAIERGTASFQVTRSGSRRWLVDAGPFLVTVKGTTFTVSWDPLSEQFDLRMRHGSVVVSGPVSAGEIALRAGQRLVVNLARTETMITEEEPEPGSEAVGAAAPQAVTPPALPPSDVSNKPAGPIPSEAPAPSSVSKTSGERRWSDELARGHWDRILDEVQRIGVEATLSKAPGEDLFALAYAARYRRRPDLARAALLAARRRFPDSPRALEAIFLLGRVEESREGGIAQAIAQYDEYLARAPTGPFVAEALGRKMTLTDKLEGAVRARPVAEEYLRRFPKGSYAGSARALMRVP